MPAPCLRRAAEIPERHGKVPFADLLLRAAEPAVAFNQGAAGAVSFKVPLVGDHGCDPLVASAQKQVVAQRRAGSVLHPVVAGRAMSLEKQHPIPSVPRILPAGGDNGRTVIGIAVPAGSRQEDQANDILRACDKDKAGFRFINIFYSYNSRAYVGSFTTILTKEGSAVNISFRTFAHLLNIFTYNLS